MNKIDLNTSIASLDSRLVNLDKQILSELDSLLESNKHYLPAEAINSLLTHWLETYKPDMQSELELDLARMSLYVINSITRLSHLHTVYVETKNLRNQFRKEVGDE